MYLHNPQKQKCGWNKTGWTHVIYTDLNTWENIYKYGALKPKTPKDRV